MDKLIKELNNLEARSNSVLSAEKIEKIVSNGKLLHIKKQTLLVSPHMVCDKIYFVIKGGFVCRYINETLEIEKTINFFLEDFHPFMSCVDSYFSGTKTHCELRAISNSEVLEYHKEYVDDTISQDIQLFQFYHSAVTRALQEENDLKLKIIAFSSEQLYSYLINHCPEVIQQVPSRFIAEFMGISAEWLSKLKHRI